MGVASGCGEQEVGVASGSGWNLWVWLLGVVVRRYIDFLILLIPTPLVSVPFTAASLLFVHFFIYKNEKHYKNEQKSRMLLQKRADTRGVVVTDFSCTISAV